MSNPNIIKPLVLKKKGDYLHMIVIVLVMLAIVVALRPILMKSSHPISAFYYPFYGSIFAIVLCCLLYMFAPSKNETIFRINEKGVYFRYDDEKKPHSFEWSELKKITAQWCYNEKGFKERGVCIFSQEDDVKEFCVFKYFAFGWMETPRLKKAVDYFSKGSVPFETAKLSLFYMNK